MKLSLIATDFDGVWTDGKVYVTENGLESVKCSRKDTLRIPEIRSRGIQIAILSKERNPVGKARCLKIPGMDYWDGLDDKLSCLKEILEQRRLNPAQVMYVGDDINDLECLHYVGMPVTVRDGDPLCKQIATYITKRNGGDHAMREIFDLVLEGRF